MLWTYVKPATQLVVYYVALGKFLQLDRQIDNYVIYLFSGMVAVNFFNEVFRNTTGSIVWNAPLVGKIYLPRELFPVSSLWVAFVHFLPQVGVLLVGALVFGWRPGPSHLGAFVFGVIIVALMSLGLGLMFAAWNVLFRDAENFVELIGMVVIWLSPVFYNWSLVRRAAPDWLWVIYQANPLVSATNLFHYAFWVPTRGVRNVVETLMPPNWLAWSGAGLLGACILVGLGQMVFRHHEAKFAQEL
jgi:ABC-2 type transport system permease protein